MLGILLDSMNAAWHCHVKSQQRMTLFFFFFNRITVILTKPPWFSFFSAAKAVGL